MSRLFLWVVAGALCWASLGCQRYDLEPVEPLAVRSVTVHEVITSRSARADLMLMVDRSGSMNLPVDPADARCAPGCGSLASPCGPTCPTRWTDLRGAMDGFLTRHGDLARMGLTLFPGPFSTVTPQCTPGSVRIDISQSDDVRAELQAHSDAIRAAINAETPKDGTPTGRTLQVLEAYPPLANDRRADYVLLLTDGLPNCNLDNPYDYNVDPVACRCTDANTSSCSQAGRRLCLDQDATMAAIGRLRALDVKTIVVGFGSETASGDAPEVLEAMGKAGGFAIRCPGGQDSECLGGTCDLATQTCSNAYYQARDGAALGDALANLAGIIDPFPCDYVLPMAPSQPGLLSVRIDDQTVNRGPDTWQYVPATASSPPKVELLGALCDRARPTDELNPLDIKNHGGADPVNMSPAANAPALAAGDPGSGRVRSGQ